MQKLFQHFKRKFTGQGTQASPEAETDSEPHSKRHQSAQLTKFWVSLEGPVRQDVLERAFEDSRPFGHYFFEDAEAHAVRYYQMYCNSLASSEDFPCISELEAFRAQFQQAVMDSEFMLNPRAVKVITLLSKIPDEDGPFVDSMYSDIFTVNGEFTEKHIPVFLQLVQNDSIWKPGSIQVRLIAAIAEFVLTIKKKHWEDAFLVALLIWWQANRINAMAVANFQLGSVASVTFWPDEKESCSKIMDLCKPFFRDSRGKEVLEAIADIPHLNPSEREKLAHSYGLKLNDMHAKFMHQEAQMLLNALKEESQRPVFT